MKNTKVATLIATAVLTLASFGAHADQRDDQRKIIKNTMCDTFVSIAGIAVTTRDRGYTVRQTLDLIEPELDEDFNRIMGLDVVALTEIIYEDKDFTKKDSKELAKRYCERMIAPKIDEWTASIK